MNTAKLENGRIVGSFEYIEKENTSSKDLPYMKEFVPLDIEAHKVDLFLKKSDNSKNNSKESSRSNSRTDTRPTPSSSKTHVNEIPRNKNKHTDLPNTTYSSSSLKSTSKNNKNSKNNNRSNNSDNSSSRPRSRN